MDGDTIISDNQATLDAEKGSSTLTFNRLHIARKSPLAALLTRLNDLTSPKLLQKLSTF